jgi:hypothetical protein
VEVERDVRGDHGRRGQRGRGEEPHAVRTAGRAQPRREQKEPVERERREPDERRDGDEQRERAEAARERESARATARAEGEERLEAREERDRLARVAEEVDRLRSGVARRAEQRGGERGAARARPEAPTATKSALASGA